MPDLSDPASVWQAVLGRLTLEIPKEHFNTFLRPSVGQRWDGACLVVAAASSFAVSWLEIPLHLAMARDALAETLGREVALRYEAMPSVAQQAVEDRAAAPALPRKGSLWTLKGHLPAGMTFDTYLAVDGLLGAVTAPAALSRWAQSPAGWRILIGPPGVGKTHLAWAAAQVAGKERDVLFADWRELVSEMLRCIDDSVKGIAKESEKITVSAPQRAPVLVLDDVRKPRTPWEGSILDDIVRYRYDRASPTLITADLTTEEMQAQLDRSVVSRLLDCELTTVSHLIGPDYRRRG